MDKRFHVFVYGTLIDMHKRSFRSAQLIGRARSNDKFVLLDGGYPMALPPDRSNADPGHILGQVFSVDERTLRALDSYEGYPDYYDRREVSVKIIDEDIELSPWMYYGSRNGGEHEAVRRKPIQPDENENVQWRSF